MDCPRSRASKPSQFRMPAKLTGKIQIISSHRLPWYEPSQFSANLNYKKLCLSQTDFEITRCKCSQLSPVLRKCLAKDHPSPPHASQPQKRQIHSNILKPSWTSICTTQGLPTLGSKIRRAGRFVGFRSFFVLFVVTKAGPQAAKGTSSSHKTSALSCVRVGFFQYRTRGRE